MSATQRDDPRAGPGARVEVQSGGLPDSTKDTAPHLLAEAAVLGASMWSVKIAQGVVDTLDVEDFDRHAHQLVYEAVSALLDAEEHVDSITVTDVLAANDQLDAVGGAAAVFDLSTIEVCPVPQAWRSYARIVKDAAARRRRIVELRRELRALEVAA